MTKGEVNFTRIIRSRAVGVLIVLAGVFMTLQANVLEAITPLIDTKTIAFPSPSTWISGGELSMWVNLVLLTGIGGMMIAINRTFNLLRTLSVFFAAFFVFITAATPTIAGQLTGSTLLAVVLLLCMWIMFTLYNVRQSDRRIFLVFFLLGLGALVQYAFFFYIPIFIAALGQMRIFRFKKILAAVLGNITPAWIAWGLDLVPVPEIPKIIFTPPSMLLQAPGGWPFLVTVAFTLIVGFFLGSVNLLKIIGFNAQARAYNGLLSLVAIATGIFAIVNFTNIAFYVTLLNVCVAFQVGHFFRFTVMRRGYIVITAIMATYLGLYFWAIFS